MFRPVGKDGGNVNKILKDTQQKNLPDYQENIMSSYVIRKTTRKVKVGSLSIGGDAPLTIQSMTNIPIENTEGNIRQINELVKNGADIVRIAIRNEQAIAPFGAIVKAVSIPLVADIHFDHRLAIAAINAGASKIRINPGNIGDEWKVREVVIAARANNIPIRIGVNGGSINRKKFSHVTPESLVDSAMENIRILEDNNFEDIIISIKSSDIFNTIEANSLMSGTRNYPIHIGLTEAGYGLSCIVQSSIAIGHLLMNGIGDTIRVSMTGDPVNEAIIGRKILESIDLRYSPVRIVSCPTCGRTAPDIDILGLAESAEKELLANFGEILEKSGKHITVAIMGCEVNGPGEAREADFGLAGCQNGKMLLFARGEKLHTIPAEDAIYELIKEVKKFLTSEP